LKAPRGRFGRLQRQCDRAFTVHGGMLTTQQLAQWCWASKKLKRWMIGNQARAAKSLGASPMGRVGVQRVWRLR
jgi:hypothetical protein